MDNITHMLMGFAIGEAATRLSAGRQPEDRLSRLRTPLWIAGAVASSCHDLDFLYAPITGGKLGYLLHHRGHTHTLAGAIPQALLAVGLVWLGSRLPKFRKRFASRTGASAATLLKNSDLRWITATAVFSAIVHIAMDYLNVYGVHPLWPWNNRWFYGDTLFIVEPWLWASLLPALAFATRSRPATAVFATLSAVTAGLLLFSGYVPLKMALIVLAWSGSLFLLMKRFSPRARIASSLAAAAAVIAIFAVAQERARTRLELTIRESFPASTILDLAMSPLPANPVCWSVTTVELEAGRYIARRGVLSLFPRFLGAAQCPRFLGTEITAPLRSVPAPARPSMLWLGQFEGNARDLYELAAKSKVISAFLQFSRVPFWDRHPDGAAVVGDLRFDRNAGLDFAELFLNSGELESTHPKYLPPWLPPRNDVLQAQEQAQAKPSADQVADSDY